MVHADRHGSLAWTVHLAVARPPRDRRCARQGPRRRVARVGCSERAHPGRASGAPCARLDVAHLLARLVPHSRRPGGALRHSVLHHNLRERCTGTSPSHRPVAIRLGFRPTTPPCRATHVDHAVHQALPPSHVEDRSHLVVDHHPHCAGDELLLGPWSGALRHLRAGRYRLAAEQRLVRGPHLLLCAIPSRPLNQCAAPRDQRLASGHVRHTDSRLLACGCDTVYPRASLLHRRLPHLSDCALPGAHRARHKRLHALLCYDNPKRRPSRADPLELSARRVPEARTQHSQLSGRRGRSFRLPHVFEGPRWRDGAIVGRVACGQGVNPVRAFVTGEASCAPDRRVCRRRGHGDDQ
mmetsp:Transcript_18294/g.51484  ORF Transcript_18294/g.51484 Transcript_18294/m.51484 type:complete len:353 (+) Transcript_18294:1310-2368(+)